MQNNTFLGQSNSQNIIVLDEVSSTNDYLKSELSKFTPLPEYTAIMAKNQTAGRGQREKSFFGKPGESLMFSFVLYPNHLLIQQQFYLSIVVALGITDWLAHYTDQTHIKWPNDIMLYGKKVSGVLIENGIRQETIAHTVVGIGINVLQRAFPDEIAHKATSIAQHLDSFGTHPFEDMCLSIIQMIRTRYETLAYGHAKQHLLAAYNDRLFRKGEPSRFIIDGQTTTGTILHVDETGKLYIRMEGEICSFSFHEISMFF